MHFGRVPAQRRFTLCRSVVNILLALADKYIAIKFLFFGTLKGWWFVLWLAFFLVRHLLHSSSSVFWLSDFQPQWNLILPFTLKWLDWPRQYYLFRASPLRNFIAYWQKKDIYFFFFTSNLIRVPAEPDYSWYLNTWEWPKKKVPETISYPELSG